MRYLGLAWVDPVNYAQPSEWATLMKFRGRSFSVGLTRLSSVTYRDAQAAFMGWLADVQFG